MPILEKIKSLFSSKPSKQEVKQELINSGALIRTQRDNVESFLHETFGNDIESINYGLYLFDEQVADLNRQMLDRGNNAEIANRYHTEVTETSDEGIYGYSTRDEVRQLQGDAKIQRWLKDPKVKASFQVLVGQVFSDPLIVDQSGNEYESQYLHGYIDTWLDEFDGTLRGKLKEGTITALSFQNAFFEKVQAWSESQDYQGKRIIGKLASKRPGLFEFITDDYDNVIAVHSLINQEDYYHPSRFFILTFNSMFSNPYGETLFASTYKFWQAKLLVFQQMAIYANRYSQPIPTVTYTNPDHEAKAQTLSNKLFAGLNVALPEGVKAEYLKAIENGDNPFIPILEYLDKQISLGICGIDLSQGSYAADKVIAEERAMLVKDLREDIEDAVFEQLIKPLIKDNFDNKLFPLKYYPKIKFRTAKKEITLDEITRAVPVLIDNEIIYTDRLSDKNKIRQFYDFDVINDDELEDIEELEEDNEDELLEEFEEVDYNFWGVDFEDDDSDDEWDLEEKPNITNFPNKGDNEPLRLIKSDYPLFDLEFAEMVRIEYPEIWARGGNIRGNKAYKLAKRAIRSDYDETVEDWVKEREAWAARHFNNHRVPGIVAQMKWLVIGSQGQRYMKSVIRQLMKQIDAEKEED